MRWLQIEDGNEGDGGDVEGDGHCKRQERLAEDGNYSGNRTMERLGLVKNEMSVHLLPAFDGFKPRKGGLKKGPSMGLFCG